jgi:hypothetical protein
MKINQSQDSHRNIAFAAQQADGLAQKPSRWPPPGNLMNIEIEKTETNERG